jgi:hypothetical protein
MLAFHPWRFRFSLRALLVFLTLFAIWGGYHANEAIKERKAEEVLARYHASFMYGPKRAGSGIFSEIKFRYQKLIQLIWQRRFITYVSLAAPLDADLVDALDSLPHLESMILEPGRLTENEMELLWSQHVSIAKFELPAGAVNRIFRSQSIKQLGLCVWILRDDDCTAIGKNDQLELVSIDGSAISEEGLRQIMTAPSMKGLSFRWCHVKGDKLHTLPGSQTLTQIDCSGAPVGVEFAKFIARSPNVKYLSPVTQANDDFVAQIADHPSISAINLSGASVTERCIPDLIRWKALSAVSLARYTFPESAISELRTARPGLRIEFEQ